MSAPTPTLSKEHDLADEKASTEIYERAPVVVTAEDDKRIRRATDKVILIVLIVVYWLQVLDKTVLGYTAAVGLKEDAHLVGNEYSTLSSIAPYAQIGFQPLGAYLLVKIKPKTLVPSLVALWGASLMGMGGANSFGSLVATRILLGCFEASCLAAFSLITTSWYRRVEQPLRVAAWYSMNGMGTIVGALVVWALSHAHSKLHTHQLVFLTLGGLTVLTAPFVWYFLDNGPSSAKFLSAEDRLKAVERLRANRNAGDSTKFKWPQVKEFALDPKTYLFATLTLLSNVMPYSYSTFGPLLLNGIAGLDKRTTLLLQPPFGCLQILAIWLTSWLAYRFRAKGIFYALLYLPVLLGFALLYALPRDRANLGPLLFGFYLQAFSFGANPLLIGWIGANVAGKTKKSATMSLYMAASAAGNIIAPNLFKASDAPLYLHGLMMNLILTAITLLNIAALVAVLWWQNQQKMKQRVANGKPAKLVDLSMERKYNEALAPPRADEIEEIPSVDGTATAAPEEEAKPADEDLTDKQNDEFIYVY
ncbi:major facilitator superfamily domain-containing protein [Rhodotorula diobovata]|uniref:Major facilitator superfamily domain-containing protein n=1 Tax=Rhodotorula diobovata TaxID=5288 RepID=A0A5C5FTF7_9BASI|nr:major facilitator superfamily domain-containing protein [Rhodotorula diobovata]